MLKSSSQNYFSDFQENEKKIDPRLNSQFQLVVYFKPKFKRLNVSNICYWICGCLQRWGQFKETSGKSDGTAKSS